MIYSVWGPVWEAAVHFLTYSEEIWLGIFHIWVFKILWFSANLSPMPKYIKPWKTFQIYTKEDGYYLFFFQRTRTLWSNYAFEELWTRRWRDSLIVTCVPDCWRKMEAATSATEWRGHSATRLVFWKPSRASGNCFWIKQPQMESCSLQKLTPGTTEV